MRTEKRKMASVRSSEIKYSDSEIIYFEVSFSVVFYFRTEA